MSPVKILPARPHLDHLKDQADKLSRAFTRGDRAARDRVAAYDTLQDHAAQRGTKLPLASAQLVVAREYGFASWPLLKAHVESLKSLTTSKEAPMSASATTNTIRQDLFNFTLSLSSLQGSGVRILEGLQISADVVADPGLKAAILDVRAGLREGDSFGEHLKRYPQFFDATFISLVIAAEETGRLDVMLDRIAGLIEKGGMPSPLLVFTRQLSVMIGAGLALPQALAIIGENETEPGLKKALPVVVAAIKNGSSLPEALAEHPGVFNSFYVAMTRVGDQGGNLDVLLDRIADQIERSESLGRR